MITVKFRNEDRGNHRKYYVPVDKKDKRLFCTQPSPTWRTLWFLCSKDGEPSRKYNVKFDVKFEIKE